MTKKKKLPKENCLKNISINVPTFLIEHIDRLVDLKYFPSRSETIRIAIRDFIKNEVSFIEYVEKTDIVALKPIGKLDIGKFVQVPTGDGKFQTFKVIQK